MIFAGDEIGQSTGVFDQIGFASLQLAQLLLQGLHGKALQRRTQGGRDAAYRVRACAGG